MKNIVKIVSAITIMVLTAALTTPTPEAKRYNPDNLRHKVKIHAWCAYMEPYNRLLEFSENKDMVGADNFIVEKFLSGECVYLSPVDSVDFVPERIVKDKKKFDFFGKTVVFVTGYLLGEDGSRAQQVIIMVDNTYIKELKLSYVPRAIGKECVYTVKYSRPRSRNCHWQKT